MTGGAPPAGYVSIEVGRCAIVTLASHAGDARALAEKGTLYAGAAASPDPRPLQGRGIAYAIALPVSGTRAVVRHNRHGGLLAGLTGDLFLRPTRAPYELRMSLRLRGEDVRTPFVAMIGVTPAPLGFARADVITHEIPDSADLGSYMMSSCSAALRAEAWQAARVLVMSLNAVGARHHDLNVKNVLLAREQGALVAYVLDVDRVVFEERGSPFVALGNARRLLRSARKWRDEHSALFDEGDVAALGIPVGELK
ncbi:MAG: lipopolysaccharide kinase [Gemmatimonadetes bacterium]|nr:lipopolysaccharide kinase [Gemmatimonadota bacterium]